MPRIVETIMTTANAKGEVHIAPLGLIEDGARWIIAPFKPSKTLDNLRENPFAAASHTDDVRVFAGCVTGRKTWPLVPAHTIKGGRLAECVSHWELKVENVIEDELRPRFALRHSPSRDAQTLGGLQPGSGRRARASRADDAPQYAAARED